MVLEDDVIFTMKFRRWGTENMSLPYYAVWNLLEIEQGN
jgi:GR25 family glycosyltransferase involved in LPS biosynthesis